MPDYMRTQKGFTLIETVMAIVITGIIAATVAILLYQGTKSFQEADVRRDLTAQGNLSMERISRELRLIRCTTSGSSCNPQAADITAWTASEIRFVNTNYEGRGVRSDAGTLKLRQGSGAADPEDVLSNNLSSLSFEYLKSDGAAAASVSEIWIINATLTLAAADESLTFKASVHPRSFR